MRVFVMSLALICLISTYAHSKISGGVYEVDGFIQSTNSADNLLQMNTGVSNGCGPTSLLFVNNYWWMKMFGYPASFTTDILSARNAITNIYDGIPGVSFNQTTDTDELKQFVLDNWDGWTARKADGDDKFAVNLPAMIGWIGKDYPVILALEPDYGNNPVYGYAHIVVFYKYDSNTKRLYFFDPYYGDRGAFNSFHTDIIADAIQGEAPFLRIAP